MRRPSNILTPISVFFTVLALLAVLVAYLIRGGTLFSPGPLTAVSQEGVTLGGFESHAEFEKQCSYCHQPLTTDLSTKCLDCHVDVASAISRGDNLHATLPEPLNCADCHLDHLGNQFDPARTARLVYDHNLSGFSLIHHQQNFDATVINCESCHDPRDFSVNELTCRNCHAANDPDFMAIHMEDFPLACMQCHDGYDRMANFDHENTDFPLQGLHTEIRCGACHKNGQFEFASLDCAGCHQEPTVHSGLFESYCQNCHDTTGWKPAMLENRPFDHDQSTSFNLNRHSRNFQNLPITCRDCHVELTFEPFTNQACIDCHGAENPGFIEQHAADFNSSCISCHDGLDRMANFDHNQIFPLTGKHTELACQQCHQDQIFIGTPTECAACHAEPEIHAGSFGTDCQRCHLTSAWTPAQLQEHLFPINHGSDNLLSCQTCHIVSYAEYTCYECHEHQPAQIQEEHREEGINLEELQDCARCHPTGREE